jgi:hypothetical protein
MAHWQFMDKFGCLLLHFGWAKDRRMRFFLAALILVAADAAAAVPARIVFAGGNWAAIDFGSRCEARSRALWARETAEPFAGFAFGRGGARQGQFYVHLSRPARAGATVIVRIGSEPFLLVGKGEWAWSRAQQHRAMLRAARLAGGMRVESRDGRGRRIVDRYALAGAPTAIDAAAAACAGKSR